MKIILSLLSFFFVTLTFAQTIEVCATCEVKTIRKAVDIATPGSTILVKKGVYQESNLLIEKSIKLKGEPGAIIDGQLKGDILTIEADGFQIDGFEIINVGTSFTKDHAAVRIRKSRDFIIENLVIKKPFFAIFLERGDHGIVRNNKVYGEAVSEFNAANGIQLWYSHGNVVENNEVFKMRDGLYLEFSDSNVFKNNISENNVRYGLHFMFCHDNLVEHNLFKHNGAGIAIMFSKRTLAQYNTMENNWGGAAYGILLKEVVDSKIIYNKFIRNTTALNIEGSNRIHYEHNTFQSNGWAINSRGANYENIFVNNNFVNNSFDLSYKGSLNENSFNGNYWSEYSGYDLDRDGIGDVPYRPIKLFSYVVNKSPEAIILLRSMFIDIVDFSEKVSPVFTPDNLMDETPRMKMIKND